MLCCMRTADVDWQVDVVGILCCGDVLKGRLVNVELYETVLLISLFNDAVLKVKIIYRRLRNDNVILISELVKRCGRIDRSQYKLWNSNAGTEKNYGKPNSV
jgi:hypothetical protein